MGKLHKIMSAGLLQNMEIVGAISEGEWNTLNGMCSEEADFMAQLLGNSLLPADVPSSSNFALSSFWPNHEPHNGVVGVKESAMYSSGETNTNINSLSQGNGYSGGSSDFFLPSNFESYHPCGSQQILLTNRNPMTMDSCMISGMNYSYCAPLLANDVMEGGDFLNHDAGNGSMESDKKLSEDVLQGKTFQVGGETLKEDKPSCLSYISKKRARVPGDLPKAKRSPGSKKGVKIDDKDGDNNTSTVLNRQSSSSCCSEDDSIASHDMTGVTTSSTSKGSGKTRAIRGSATDPQSLYARKRRERINERLRILQNLVPNGTKVDISTMLEEAVQYVKFLQLQIKLLSSDDLWMYAPIAYNGMDIEALNS